MFIDRLSVIGNLLPETAIYLIGNFLLLKMNYKITISDIFLRGVGFESTHQFL